MFLTRKGSAPVTKLEAQCRLGDEGACDALTNIRIAEASYVAFILVIAAAVGVYFWRNRKDIFTLE
jgi:hypothetical protein